MWGILGKKESAWAPGGFFTCNEKLPHNKFYDPANETGKMQVKSHLDTWGWLGYGKTEGTGEL